MERVQAAANSEGASVMIIGAAIEADIAELDDAEERQMFLADLGLEEVWSRSSNSRDYYG